jgi:hypothetical protein
MDKKQALARQCRSGIYVVRNGCSPCSSQVEGRRAFDELEAKHALVEADRCFHGLALERDVVQADEGEGGSRAMRVIAARILLMEIHRGFAAESPRSRVLSENRVLIAEPTTLLVQAKRQKCHVYIARVPWPPAHHDGKQTS